MRLLRYKKTHSPKKVCNASVRKDCLDLVDRLRKKRQQNISDNSDAKWKRQHDKKQAYKVSRKVVPVGDACTHPKNYLFTTNAWRKTVNKFGYFFSQKCNHNMSFQCNKEQNISFRTCCIACALRAYLNKASFFIARKPKEETRRLKTARLF